MNKVWTGQKINFDVKTWRKCVDFSTLTFLSFSRFGLKFDAFYLFGIYNQISNNMMLIMVYLPPYWVDLRQA